MTERERRRGERHIACVPVQARLDDAREFTGMICELSVVGAQILTQRRREVGEELELSIFLIDGEHPTKEVEARVVRCEQRHDGGIWSYLTVVEFKQQLVGLEAEIKAVADAQELMLGPRSDRHRVAR